MRALASSIALIRRVLLGTRWPLWERLRPRTQPYPYRVAGDEPVEIEAARGGAVLRGVLADAPLHRCGADDEDEAHYLAAALSSGTLDELVRRSGAGRIRKKPLELPIPRYDPGNRVHREPAGLGREAAERAREVLPAVLRECGCGDELGRGGFLTPQEVGRVRRALREALSDPLSEVDRLAAQLLETGGGEGAGLLRYLSRGRGR